MCNRHNTRNQATWQPVLDFCNDKENVRFFHLDNWPFYKSGALNFARKITRTEAEFIFVVDADYNLTNDALSIAVSNIQNPSIGLVQFPQAYVCENPKHAPLLEEFDHFFDYYCRKADSCYGALATGTLSLIRIKALDQVGGWPTNSITEDAELGARLQNCEYHIKYVHRIIGKGLAPIHQEDFLKQRKRWIFGNVQTLIKYIVRPVTDLSKWISGVSQLTAWANLLGIPVLGILSCLLLFPWLRPSTFIDLSSLGYLAFYIYAVSKCLQLLLAHKKYNVLTFQTFLIHFSSFDIGAFHWWPVLWGRKRPFVKTEKSGTSCGYHFNLFYPLLHILVCICALSINASFIALSAFLFSVLHSAAMLMDYRCRSNNSSSVFFNLKLHA